MTGDQLILALQAMPAHDRCKPVVLYTGVADEAAELTEASFQCAMDYLPSGRKDDGVDFASKAVGDVIFLSGESAKVCGVELEER